MISADDMTKAQSELLGEELEGVAVVNTTGSLEPNTSSELDNLDQSRIWAIPSNMEHESSHEQDGLEVQERKDGYCLAVSKCDYSNNWQRH